MSSFVRVMSTEMDVQIFSIKVFWLLTLSVVDVNSLSQGRFKRVVDFADPGEVYSF